MKFNLKEYQRQKTRHYLKNNNFILFSINANQNAQNWVITEQNLQKFQFNYYKICNKITQKVVKNSIYRSIANTINSTFFFLKPATTQIRIENNILQLLNSIFFTILAIKLNKKVYSIAPLKNITSYHHKKNMAVFYQFLLTNIKVPQSNKTS